MTGDTARPGRTLSTRRRPGGTPSPADAPADAPTDAPAGRADSGRPRAEGPRWWPVLVPVVIVLVGAWVYRWVDEDAFINFRIIANLFAGHGLVFNVGERVEADSDPLWVATLALVHAVTPWASLEWTSVVLGLACTAGGFLAGGLAVMRLGARHDEGTVLPVGMLLSLIHISEPTRPY